jgi:hypothetical protein
LPDEDSSFRNQRDPNIIVELISVVKGVEIGDLLTASMQYTSGSSPYKGFKNIDRGVTERCHDCLAAPGG